MSTEGDEHIRKCQHTFANAETLLQVASLVHEGCVCWVFWYELHPVSMLGEWRATLLGFLQLRGGCGDMCSAKFLVLLCMAATAVFWHLCLRSWLHLHAVCISETSDVYLVHRKGCASHLLCTKVVYCVLKQHHLFYRQSI